MPKFVDTQEIPYKPVELYNLVMDIEEYPVFLPWCAASRIVEKTNDFIIADLIIQYKAFTEKYRSKVVGKMEGKDYFIEVSLVEGPFTHLFNNWKFYATENGTKVEFFLDFRFKSVILEKLIGLMFNQAAERMVAAFYKRAKEVYSVNFKN